MPTNDNPAHKPLDAEPLSEAEEQVLLAICQLQLEYPEGSGFTVEQITERVNRNLARKKC